MAPRSDQESRTLHHYGGPFTSRAPPTPHPPPRTSLRGRPREGGDAQLRARVRHERDVRLGRAPPRHWRTSNTCPRWTRRHRLLGTPPPFFFPRCRRRGEGLLQPSNREPEGRPRAARASPRVRGSYLPRRLPARPRRRFVVRSGGGEKGRRLSRISKRFTASPRGSYGRKSVVLFQESAYVPASR